MNMYSTSPNVSFIHPQLSRVWHEYTIIRDCISGPHVIKEAGTLYLPKPNAADKSPENSARYRAYKQRAIYYNVPRRTLQGLVGTVFSRDAVVNVPTTMQPIVDDATGAGVSLEHEAHKLLSFTLAYSRAGVLVDYPDTGEDGATVADIESGKIRPTITTYSPMEIVNWRVINDGARTRLSLVVLAEGYPFADDGFEIKTGCQFRVLSLVENNGELIYKVDVWRDKSPEVWDGKKIPVNRDWTISSTFYPCDATGNNLTDIPFFFVGSENNDTNVDTPSFYDLCEIALGHYRNSADYEESCYQMGQPTYWFSGITNDFLNDTLKGKIPLGSMGGVPLPEGGQAGMLVAPANTMPFEAMQYKERQMVALGARLVEQKSVQRTATEAKQDEASDTSILSACAKNVSSVIKRALICAAKFLGVDDNEIDYTLNYDFNLSQLSSDDRTQLINEFNAGLLTFSEVRSVLHKNGIATVDDDEAKEEIAKAKSDAAAIALKASVGNNPTDANDDKE